MTSACKVSWSGGIAVSTKLELNRVMAAREAQEAPRPPRAKGPSQKRKPAKTTAATADLFDATPTPLKKPHPS